MRYLLNDEDGEFICDDSSLVFVESEKDVKKFLEINEIEYSDLLVSYTNLTFEYFNIEEDKYEKYYLTPIKSIKDV